MKKIDIVLFMVVILIVAIILLLVQALAHPDSIFKALTLLGIFENSTNGMKNALFTIIALGGVSFMLILLILFRLMARMFKKY
jgi:hypothetical protein